MPKTSHAAERAPQQAIKPATLSQLGELVSLMDKGKIERDYMQDFLRRRLTRQSTVVQAEPSAEDSIIGKVEEIARQHYPDAVNEILEVLAPWCDLHLDLEFKAFRGRYKGSVTTMHSPEWEETQTVRDALFWLPVGSIQPMFLGKENEELEDTIHRESKTPYVTLGNLTGQMFSDVFTTYSHLDPEFDQGATKIMHGHDSPDWHGLYTHIDSALKRTGAMRYGLLHPFETEHGGVLGSITSALNKAIVLAAKGDRQRLERVLKFLEYQRSGRPVCHVHEGVAYVLGVKRN